MESWRKDARREAIIVDLEALVPQDHLLRKRLLYFCGESAEGLKARFDTTHHNLFALMPGAVCRQLYYEGAILQFSK